MWVSEEAEGKHAERVEGVRGVRWDGLRGGQGFGVSAFPPAPGNSLWLQWEKR